MILNVDAPSWRRRPMARHNNVHSDASPKRSFSKMRGSTTLTTSLRRAEQHDIEVAIEAPPLATFTVPSFRSRKHRGGENILLKHAYPSGFCQQTKLRHHYTLSAAATADERRQMFASSSIQGGLVSETKGLGVPKRGAASNKGVLNVTWVVVGAEVVDAGAGNDLVHFGPEFPCGPTEYLSPRRPSHRARPPSPLSPTPVTIDGSTLKEQDFYTVSRAEPENYQSSKQLGCCTSSDSERRPSGGQASIYGQGERERNRILTVDTAERAHSADTSVQQQCPRSSESLPAMIPSKSCAGRHNVLHSSHSGGEGVDGGGVAPDARASMGERVNVESTAEQDNSFRPTPGQKTHGKDDKKISTATRRCVDTDPREPSTDERLHCSRGYKESLEGRATVEDDERSSEVSTTLPNVAHPVDSGQIPSVTYGDGVVGRVGVELGLALLDEQSGALEEEAWAVSGNNSSTFQAGSACPLESVTTLEASSASCESSLSGSSVDPVTAKRSLSSLDTEWYGGTMSKDAAEIVRSHLESQTLHSKELNASLSSGHGILSTENVTVTSPAPPSSSRLQLLDSLLGVFPGAGHTVRQASPETVLLHPVARPRGCYVRTRGDVILAVVRRKQLLDCKHDMGLRAVKAAARPVCIKVDMPLAEGIRAILASGVLLQAWAEEGSRSHQEGRVPWGSASSRGAGGQSASLQYFDFRAGEWKAILSERDWKVMLAAPAGAQGAGVTFGGGGTNGGRGADFLVAVAAAPRSPRELAISARKLSETALPTLGNKVEGGTSRASADSKKPAWRCAEPATPSDVIRSAERHTKFLHHDESLIGLQKNRDIENKARSDKNPLAALETGPQHLRPEHSMSSATISDDGSIRDSPYQAHQEQSPVLLDRELVGLVKRGRQRGPGPGAAVGTSAAGRGGGCCSATRGPKKSKVRSLVKHLEARLKLKGTPGAGGLQGAPLLKIDMPYTKELAKWGYDEILGIRRVTVPAGCCA